MRVRLLTACTGLLAALCLAAPAAAHHSASATAASLTLDPAECAFKERRAISRCDGTRVARVTWSVECGARPFVTVVVRASRAGGGSPIRLATEDGGEAASGITTTIIEPGARVFATVSVDCYYEQDASGSGPESHSAVATSAPTPEVLVPPWLREVRAIYNNFCNVNPPGSGAHVMQAGQHGILDFGIDFRDRSLLGVKRRSPAGVRKMWLRASGAGIRARKHPELFLLGEFGRRQPISAGLRLNPRRAKPLELWAEVGGVRTNSLMMRVLPRRC